MSRCFSSLYPCGKSRNGKHCYKTKDYLLSFNAIVADYIKQYRNLARAELRFLKQQPHLASAIENAVIYPWGDNRKRHPHQRRIPQAALDKANRKLQEIAGELQSARDFASLYQLVKHEIISIRKIGELTVYDTAHRLGGYLGKSPKLVYLHAGTKIGARHLGFSGATLHPRNLPKAFAKLTPAEIEDCLCIYSNDIAGIVSRDHRKGGNFSSHVRFT